MQFIFEVTEEILNGDVTNKLQKKEENFSQESNTNTIFLNSFSNFYDSRNNFSSNLSESKGGECK